MRASAAVLAVAAFAAVGCGDVDKEEYVARNVAVLDRLPVFPGATAGETTSTACRSNDTSFARTVGYYTIREYLLDRPTEPKRVIAFYKRAAGEWTPRDESAAPSVNLVRGKAFAHVLAGRTRYSIGVDHSSAGCPGP